MDSKLAKQCMVPGHTGLVTAWCQTCQRFVCIQGMVSKTHSGHVFISLEEVVEERRAATEKRKEELRKIKENVEALLSHQLEKETQFNENIEEINNAIGKRSDSFLSDIESWKTKTKLLLQKQVEENKERMKDRQNQIKEDQNKLQTALDRCSDENHEAYLVMTDELIHAKRQSSVYSPNVLSLTDGNSVKLDTDAMLGTISDEDSHGSDCVSIVGQNFVSDSNDVIQLYPAAPTANLSTEETRTDNTGKAFERIYDELTTSDDVEIINHSQFQCNDQKGEVVKLAASREGGVWVTWTGKRCIKYFDDKGNSAKQILTNFDVSDIGVNSKKELFASVNNGSRIKRKGIILWDSIIKTEPLVTYGIHITSADEILVCLQAIDHGEIGRYSPTGGNLQRIRLDRDFKKIFLRPRQLLEIGPTGDVLVIVDGTLITLDKDGKVKKTWSGELDSDTNKKGAMSLYEPVSLAVTSDANVFVLDNGNRRIVVFDKLGDVLWVMNDTVMLKNMRSAVFDNKGQIWVACTDGAIHKANLRIHRKTKTD